MGVCKIIAGQFFHFLREVVLDMRIGLIGVGTIGTFLLKQLNQENVLGEHRVTAVFDARKESQTKLEQYADMYQFTYHHHLDDFLNEPIDLVVECANIAVIQDYARSIIKRKSLLVISVGALVSTHLLEDLKSLSDQSKQKVYLPSGAIGGLDILQSARVLHVLDSVKLTTRKPTHALTDKAVDKPTTLYSGPAKEAIHQFPKNANVAIILSLAGIGIHKTDVHIIADPNVTTNTHHVEAIGDFGTLSLTLNNRPSPNNPKTSYLTSLSILSALQSLDQNIHIC